MEYTATFAIPTGTLPVVVIADSFIMAAAKAAIWRENKKDNAIADGLISSEPISIVNDTLRMQYER